MPIVSGRVGHTPEILGHSGQNASQSPASWDAAAETAACSCMSKRRAHLHVVAVQDDIHHSTERGCSILLAVAVAHHNAVKQLASLRQL